MVRNKTKIIITMLIIYVLILIPSMHIPMHSDDYFYYFLGNSPKEIYDHYIIWSGRVLANTISSTLLFNFNHTVVEIINSLAFLGLCFFISIIPIAVSKEKKHYSPFVVIFIFLAYWVSNPKLGETSFWIVGSANYLWTNLFIAIFIFSMFMSSKTDSRLYPLMTLLLGVFAGCSNENTSIVVVMLSITLLIFEKNKLSLTSGLVGSIIGASILLLAPGNQNRATLYQDWHNTPFKDKFFTHFFERFPASVEEYWIVLVLLVIMLLFVSATKVISSRFLSYSLIFIVCAMLSNAAFLGSPAFPERSMNGGLCFLLIAASFIATEITQSNSKNSAYCISIVSIALLFYFLPSYFWFTTSVVNNWNQDIIRQSIIANAKANGSKDIYIPEFYFTTLAKPSDALDTYQNQKMDDYFHVNKLIKYDIPFDYSHILRGEFNPVYGVLGNDISLVGEKRYSQIKKFSVNDNLLLKFKLQKSPIEILKNGEEITASIKCQNSSLAISKRIDLIQIGDYFYSNIELGSCKPKKNEPIIIKIVSSDNKKAISEFILD